MSSAIRNYFLLRILSRPITKSIKNVGKAIKQTKAQQRKAKATQARTVILRSTEEINNALKLCKIEKEQQAIRKMKAETALIEARTEQLKDGGGDSGSGQKFPQCPKCKVLFSGHTECPNCKVELVKVNV